MGEFQREKGKEKKVNSGGVTKAPQSLLKDILFFCLGYTQFFIRQWFIVELTGKSVSQYTLLYLIYPALYSLIQLIRHDSKLRTNIIMIIVSVSPARMEASLGFQMNS